MAGACAQGEGGTPGNPLKVSIALGQKPAIIQKGPFYLMKPEPIIMSEVTGANNLMASRNLENSFQKLASKKMKDSLSSFLPGLPGAVDTPGSQDNSSLRGLIDKPPVGGKEILPLNSLQLAGFRLHPGPLPESYRNLLNAVSSKEKKKHKKKKHRGGSGGDTPGHMGGQADSDGRMGQSDLELERERMRLGERPGQGRDQGKKHKKHDREKRKKDKKKKRSKEDKDM